MTPQAVPFHDDAKWPLVGNRVTPPTSINSRAAPDGPMPFSVSSEVPVASMSSRSSLSVADALVDALEVADELGGDATAGFAGGVSRPHLRQQCLGLRS